MINKILKRVNFIRADGGLTSDSARIVRETALTVNLDGRHFATAMVLATLEKEFAIGNLFAQGIIRRTTDIASLTVKKNIVDVRLAEHNTPAALPEKVVSDLTVHHEDVIESVRAILKSEVFTETEAVHSAGLFLDGKEAVCIAEDLGRHNALDKVIGAGLLRNVAFGRTLAASTGRQPTEMIFKCLRAGIPIIATKGVPTTLAVAMAEKAGITIAGLVRSSTMIVYSHPEKIQ
jgi:FdhD protein